MSVLACPREVGGQKWSKSCPRNLVISPKGLKPFTLVD